MKIGFCGLGIMGYPMAGHLQKKGLELEVYNRSIEKSKKWSNKYQGVYQESLPNLAKDKDLVITCISNDNALKEVILGKEGILENIKEGATIIDHSTVSANISKEIYEKALEKGVHFLDAPISGGEIGAQKGILTIMVGGNEEVLKKHQNILDIYGKKTTYMGKSGNGQLTKMVNQICIAANYIGLAEALKFAEKSNLDIKNVISAIAEGSAASWAIDNRAETMHERKFDFGFPIYLIAKDLGIVLDEANSNDIFLPISSILKQFYNSLEKDFPTEDASALIKFLDKNN